MLSHIFYLMLFQSTRLGERLSTCITNVFFPSVDHSMGYMQLEQMNDLMNYKSTALLQCEPFHVASYYMTW